MILTNVLYFAIALLVLAFSAYLLLRAIEKLALFFRVSEFSLAFILIAVSTSFPELTVGITSAIKGIPSLSFGNVIGANILDLTMALAIPILIAGKLKIETKTEVKDAFYAFLVCILAVSLYIIGNGLSRIDGAILLAIFIIYSKKVMMKKKAKKSKKSSVAKKEAFVYGIIFLISSLLLVVSAKYVVKYAHLIAIEAGLSDFIIGLLIVAIGTTLPELTVNTISVLTRHYSIAIGDSVGSISANLTLIVGLTALIHPIKGNFATTFGSGAFMIIVVYMFYLLIKDRTELKRVHGLALIFIYAAFLIFQYLLNSAKI